MVNHDNTIKIDTGFTDHHGHIIALGIKLNSLDFGETKDAEECVELAARHNELRGGWLVGRGWNHELWNKKVFPDKHILDKFFRNIPVYFIRIDGHAAWVNSKALEIAGINPHTKEPHGGSVLRFKNGQPTGILLDNAMELVHKLIPKYSDKQLEGFILSSIEELSGHKITEVHDMDVNPEFIHIFKRLDNENKLKIRIKAFISAQNDEYIYNRTELYKGSNFSIEGIKLYSDGALGSRGAAMLEPYSDSPETKGILLLNEIEMYEKAKRGLELGFQVAVHAIGDAANRMVINVFKKLYDNKVADDNSILRIEHAQHIHPDDLKIFQDYKSYCSVQPVHCLSDAPMARKRLRERINYSYPWKSILDNGGILMGGSDFPIENHDPLKGIEAFTDRIPYGESEPWFPGEIITHREAIQAFSSDVKKFN